MNNFVKVCSILFALIAALALQPLTAIAQQASHPANKGLLVAALIASIDLARPHLSELRVTSVDLYGIGN